MKIAAGAILLAAAVVLISLALVYMLVRTNLVSAELWSFFPVILALSLAVVFALTALKQRRAQKGNGGTSS